LSYVAVLAGLRRVSAAVPPGRLFGRDWRTTGELFHEHGLPRVAQVLAIVRAEGKTAHDALREALGADALRLRRVSVRTREDVLSVLEMALTEGILDGTTRLAIALPKRRQYVPSYSMLTKAAHDNGTTVGRLYIEAQDRLGWRWDNHDFRAGSVVVRLEAILAESRRDWLRPCELSAVAGWEPGAARRWISGSLPHADGDVRNPWRRGEAPVNVELGRLRRRIPVRELSTAFVAAHVDLGALEEVLRTWPSRWLENDERRRLRASWAGGPL